jgi:hypothetical protein
MESPKWLCQTGVKKGASKMGPSRILHQKLPQGESPKVGLTRWVPKGDIHRGSAMTGPPEQGTNGRFTQDGFPRGDPQGVERLVS